MIIIPNIDLVLNFKQENKSYKFVKDKTIDVSEEVFEYLQKRYPGKFEKIVPITNTINDEIENYERKSENLLDKLLEIEDRNKEVIIDDEEILKDSIKKAIEQKIIVKNGTKYKIGEEIIKGLPNVKKYLEKNEDILKKILMEIKWI